MLWFLSMLRDQKISGSRFYGDLGPFVIVFAKAQRLSGIDFGLRLRGCRFEPHRRHCFVSLSKTLYPLLSKGLTNQSNI